MQLPQYILDIIDRIENGKIPYVLQRLRPMWEWAGNRNGGETGDTTRRDIRRDEDLLREYYYQIDTLRAGGTV